MSKLCDIVVEVIKGLKSMREECNNGHIAPKKVGYVITTAIDPLRHSVTMFCAHCRAVYERPFSPEEVKELYKFHASLREYRVTV